MIAAGDVVYGVRLDPADPYLERNLARLEIRFLNRYMESVKKSRDREEEGKPPHKTVLRSIEENRQRLEKVRMIQQFLLEAHANGHSAYNGTS